MQMRVDSLSLHKQAFKNIQNTQLKLLDTQQKVTSGYKYNSFDAMAEDGVVNSVFDLDATIKKVSNYSQNNELIANRLRMTDEAIKNIHDNLLEFSKQIIFKNSVTKHSIDINSIAHNGLDMIQNILNLNYENRYIFAGSKVDTRPVSDLVKTSNLINGTPTSNYYQGDDENLSVNISDTQKVNYNIKANNPIFVKIIGAYNLAIEAERTDDSQKYLEVAKDINILLTDLINMRTNIAGNMKMIKEVNEIHDNTKRYFTDNINRYTSTDELLEISNFQQIELVLRASYQLSIEANKLSIVNMR